MTNLVGQSLQSGKYTLDQELGKGGFGITYKAINSTLSQVVVIKTLNSSLQKDSKVAKLSRQFQDEARRLAKCSHPNIVRVSDFFIEDELPYIVMEYIPGLTLEQIVLPDNPLPEATAIQCIRQVGEALKVVHHQGLLHRDINPKNLILRKDTQQVVLIDFGIAREFELGSIQAHTNLVSEGYAPIEQYLPEAVRTPATDVYGLAATLYSLLTAKIPPSAIGRYHLSPMDPRQVRPELSKVVSQAVMWGMSLESKDRPANVDDWLALLPKITSSSVVKIESTSSVTTKSVIPQHLMQTGVNVVKSEHLFPTQENKQNSLGFKENKGGINSSEEAKTQLISETSSRKLVFTPLNTIYNFLISRQKKVMVLAIASMLLLGALPLARWRTQFSSLTPTGENIKQFKPVQLPATIHEESGTPTIDETFSSPMIENSATPIPFQSVDEIPSAQDKLPVQSSTTKNLSETLVRESDRVTEQSPPLSSTPIDETFSVEPKRIIIPSEAASILSEPQITDVKELREEINKRVEQHREEVKRKVEQHRERARGGERKRKYQKNRQK